jgi:2-oxoglutarate dehydrogenase complex dehydrogenase (E1) component-like enzyme
MDVGNAELIEQLHLKFVRDPTTVPAAWRHYFEQVHRADAPSSQEPTLDDIRRLMRERAHGTSAARPAGPSAAPASDALATEHIRKQAAVLRLIHSYRLLGHHRAQVDPIKLRSQPVVPDLDPAFHGLTEDDLDTVFTCRQPGRQGRSSRCAKSWRCCRRPTPSHRRGVHAHLGCGGEAVAADAPGEHAHQPLTTRPTSRCACWSG